MKSLARCFMVALLVTTLAMVGCDDGSDGAAGVAGLDAYEQGISLGIIDPAQYPTAESWLNSLQSAATTAEPEQCAVCHSDVAATHAETGVPVIVSASGVDSAGDYVLTLNLEVDGVGTNQGYQLYRVYKTINNSAILDPTAITTLERDGLFSLRNENASDCSTYASCTIPNDLAGFTSAADGTFTVTIAAADVAADAVYTVILRNLDSTDQYGWGHYEPATLVTRGVSPLRNLVSDDGESEGCASCHGATASQLFDHYRVAGDECQVCHSRYDNPADLYAKDETGTWVNTGGLPGGNFTEYIHGIHNSHSMPGDGTYVRDLNNDGSPNDTWSVGYPSAMRNCQTCHVTDVQLDAAVTAPVSFYLCMTCHQSWDGFIHGHDAEDGSYAAGDQIMTGLLGSLHRPLGLNDSCLGASCHSVASRNEAGDFHNDFLPDDTHYDSFYRGRDVSFANDDEVAFELTGVTSDGSAVSFTWTASTGSGPGFAATDPCNTDLALGPVYAELGAYLAYAKGDDWVNEFVGSAPGQPQRSSNLFTSLTTTCDMNDVATTTGLVLDEEALVYADKVLLAIGGKPLVQGLFDATPQTYYVRVPSPTLAFDPADGTTVMARRDAVNNAKCLGCHQGTLYQHGGDRVDNEQLCVICHNPSSNDKNNRRDFYEIVNADGTVDTTATYDNKNAETYDMRTMLHAIHGVEQRLETGGKPWTVYRSRGIYSFALSDTLKPATWPVDGVTVNGCTSDGIRSNDDPNCEIAHNWVVVHYPKPVNDCDACHNDGEYEATDQTLAVGVSIDAGFDWPDQSDDTIIGPSAAACTACHAGAAQRSHAQSNGYKANVTKDEMLEKAQ